MCRLPWRTVRSACPCWSGECRSTVAHLGFWPPVVPLGSDRAGCCCGQVWWSAVRLGDAPPRGRPPFPGSAKPGAVITTVRLAGSSRRRSISGPAVAPGAAACRYWPCAGAATELRMLRPGSRPGIPGRAHLHVRVHLVPRLRGERPARHLPELRRRASPAPRPPGPPARRRPAVGQAGSPARLCPGIRR